MFVLFCKKKQCDFKKSTKLIKPQQKNVVYKFQNKKLTKKMNATRWNICLVIY